LRGTVSKQENVLGGLAALGSAAAWAFGTILVKGPTGRFSALYISAFRSVFAALLVVVTVAAVGQIHEVARIPGWAIGFLLSGSVIVVLGDLAFVRAIALDDMSRVFPVTTGLYILTSVLASALFFHERVTWLTFVGGLLVIVSVSLIAMARQPGSRQQTVSRKLWHVPGLLLSVVAAVLWTVSLFILDKAMTVAEPMPAVVLRIPFTAVLLLAMGWVRGEQKRYHGIGRRDVVALVVSGVLVGLSGILFTAAVRWESAGIVSILSSTSPLFVVPVAILVLKEPVNKNVIVGTGLCMVGIWLTMI
jgi:drug/metabolite transporter (DMT)-like permease